MHNIQKSHKEALLQLGDAQEWKYVSSQIAREIGLEKYNNARESRDKIKTSHLAVILHEQHYMSYGRLQSLIYDIFIEVLPDLKKVKISEISVKKTGEIIEYYIDSVRVHPSWIPSLKGPSNQAVLQYNDYEALQQHVRELEGESEKTRSKGKFTFRDVVQNAVRKNASDIHLIPKEEFYHIFFRINGDLVKQPEYVMSLDEGFDFATQIAIDATDYTKGKFSSDNLLLAQEGRIEFADMTANGVDVRLEFIPDGMMGKRLTIIARILKRQRIEGADLKAKGYDEDAVREINDVAKRTGGLCIVSGITGSGKSTLVADILASIDSRKRIYTIEDPIEYLLAKDNITQHQIYIPPKKDGDSEHKQMGFAEYAKALKRADPDIVNIGEMRNNPDLVKAIFEMANAGQLIYTTVHIRSAFEIFHALEQVFGIPSHSTMPLVFFSINLKLSKRLCDHCKIKDERNAVNLKKLRQIEDNIPYEYKNHLNDFIRQPDMYQTYLKGQGCEHCDNGYSGRVPMYEYFRPNVEMVEWMLEKRPTRYQIEQKACSTGIGKNKLSVFMKRLVSGEVDTSDEILQSIM